MLSLAQLCRARSDARAQFRGQRGAFAVQCRSKLAVCNAFASVFRTEEVGVVAKRARGLRDLGNLPDVLVLPAFSLMQRPLMRIPSRFECVCLDSWCDIMA